jgi:hypothetical protein
MRFAVGPRTSVALGFGLAVCGWTEVAPALSCDSVPRVLYTYPSAEQPSVPRDAVFWVVPDGFTRVASLQLDGRSLPEQAAGGIERMRFEPEQQLSPGPHELGLQLQLVSLRGTRELSIPFEVTDQLAGAMLEAASVSVQPGRVTQFVAEHINRRQQDRLARERSELLAREDDCSDFVLDQHFRCEYDEWLGLGSYRVEFEVQGDALGFFALDSFLPADCRGSFFPSVDTPFEVYPITAAGAAPPALFGGVPEVHIPEGAQALPAPKPGYCSLLGRSSSSGWPSWYALLWGVGLLTLRRRPAERSRRSGRP